MFYGLDRKFLKPDLVDQSSLKQYCFHIQCGNGSVDIDEGLADWLKVLLLVTVVCIALSFPVPHHAEIQRPCLKCTFLSVPASPNIKISFMCVCVLLTVYHYVSQ
jgi:hypothetical protein